MTQSPTQTEEKNTAPESQLFDPTDVRDECWVETESKTRSRARTIADIEWLARMSDKARAHAKGTIGDYIFNCPADKKLLAALELDHETFQKIAVDANTDDELIAKVKETSPAFKENRFSFSRNAPAAKSADRKSTRLNSSHLVTSY